MGTPTLIYRASRDGKSNVDFHLCCDGKSNTITFVKSNPKADEEEVIIGGYTSIEWNTPKHEDPYIEDLLQDNEGFIFSVTRQ